MGDELVHRGLLTVCDLGEGEPFDPFRPERPAVLRYPVLSYLDRVVVRVFIIARNDSVDLVHRHHIISLANR